LVTIGWHSLSVEYLLRRRVGAWTSAAPQRMGSTVPGRAPPHRQSDDRAHRPRSHWRGAGHQDEVAWDGLECADQGVRPGQYRCWAAGGRSLMDESVETFVPLKFRRRGLQRVATD